MLSDSLKVKLLNLSLYFLFLDAVAYLYNQPLPLLLHKHTSWTLALGTYWTCNFLWPGLSVCRSVCLFPKFPKMVCYAPIVALFDPSI